MPVLIVFVQVGSPRSADPRDVKQYLRQFLSDPFVIGTNSIWWRLFLELVILPFRSKDSAAKYARILDPERGFPLVYLTQDFAEAVQKDLNNTYVCQSAFLVGEPSVHGIISSHWQSGKYSGVVALPMFPQYSETTHGAAKFQLHEAMQKLHIPREQLTVLPSFFRLKGFYETSARHVSEHLSHQRNSGISIDRLFLSFHGLPKKNIVFNNEPYHDECYQTAFLIQSELRKLDVMLPVSIVFQSRFGRSEWLEPSIDQEIKKCVNQGEKVFAVYCPAFTTDCLETIDEIGFELKEEARHAYSAEIHFIPCLNTNRDFSKSVANWVSSVSSDSNHTMDAKHFFTDTIDIDVPPVTFNQEPLSPKTRKVFKVVLLSLLMDLIGFSIIFPMFPAIAEFYVRTDSEDFFLNLIYTVIHRFQDFGGVGANPFWDLVLFGGILGSIYSLLQFVSSTIWGKLSDHFGRRPVLIISITGLTVSYIMWGFAGTFTTLFLSRMLGGIMGGKISTATAVVADVTNEKTRSKGMALVGMMFGLGFVLGPVIGGILSKWNLAELLPSLAPLGVNPFSLAAFFAAILSLYNLYLVLTAFPETFPKEERLKKERFQKRSLLNFMRLVPEEGVNRVNFTHFIFLFLFSGLEFAITFLAVERFQYTPMDNGMIFGFAGLLIAFVQGGIVRRYAHSFGERKMALMGFVCLIPAFYLMGIAKTPFLLFVGLTFMSVGGAFSIPCLTSLVSLLSPVQKQGEYLGIFRSLGSLARVFGPLTACILYWRKGSEFLYTSGAIMFCLPFVILYFLRKTKPA